MPIALCMAVMSRLVGTFAIVISPGELEDVYGGRDILMTVSGLSVRYGFITCTIDESKCFHDRISFAAAGVASIFELVSLGSEHSVSRWQWSGLSWLIMTRSGCSSSSARESMAHREV